jgi:hypothetical protein
MLDAMARLGPIDEEFPDVDAGMLPLDDIDFGDIDEGHLMGERAGVLQHTLRQRVSVPGGCEITTSAIVQCELLYGIAHKGSARLKPPTMCRCTTST